MAAGATGRNSTTGPPTRLTPDVAEAIVQLVAGGSTLVEAARAAGVSERSLRGWRRRAWSADPRDQACVQLERNLLAALATRPPEWEQAASKLAANARWDDGDWDAELEHLDAL
jgi:transposase-like protein